MGEFDIPPMGYSEEPCAQVLPTEPHSGILYEWRHMIMGGLAILIIIIVVYYYFFSKPSESPAVDPQPDPEEEKAARERLRARLQARLQRSAEASKTPETTETPPKTSETTETLPKTAETTKTTPETPPKTSQTAPNPPRIAPRAGDEEVSEADSDPEEKTPKKVPSKKLTAGKKKTKRGRISAK